MSIRLRLTIAIAALLVLATVLVSFVALRTTRNTMLEQVDNRLLSSSERLEGPGGRRARPLFAVPEGRADEDSYRETAEIVVGPTGEIVFARLAGYTDDPEALPDLPRFGSPEFSALLAGPTTLPAVEGSLEYRVLAFGGGDGAIVFATSLDDVNATSRDLLRTMLAAGGLVVVFGAALAWWIIGRGLRPVDRMIDTATAIAAGDLSQRVEHTSGDRSELGRLAGALDEMMVQLEASFEQQSRSEARLRRFVGDASHELRTPVSAIRGYAELYRSGGIEPGEPLDRAIGRIEGESIRMGHLVEDLLLLARMDEQLPLDKLPVDLAEVAEDAVSDVRATDPDRPVTLDARESVVVEGDAARLHQVIANLLANARQHTPPGTAVRVAVKLEGDDALVSVADDGLGIAPEHRDRIFERFYRADVSRTRATGGSGLGLSIVSAVVEAHGGTVDLDSKPGRGTTFTIRLPVQ